MSDEAAAAPEDESPTSEGGAAAGSPGLVVLSGDPAERDHAEALAELLGVQVWAPPPEDLGPEAEEHWSRLRGAHSVISFAEYGPRSGIEVIEELSWGEPRPGSIALALERPSRLWIEAALRAGATTCVRRPLDAEELKAKLVLGGEDSGGESGDREADGDGSEEEEA